MLGGLGSHGPSAAPVGARSSGDQVMDDIRNRWDAIVASATDPRGQGLAEYALILALVAIIAIVALIFLGGQISGILSEVGVSI